MPMVTPSPVPPTDSAQALMGRPKPAKAKVPKRDFAALAKLRAEEEAAREALAKVQQTIAACDPMRTDDDSVAFALFTAFYPGEDCDGEDFTARCSTAAKALRNVGVGAKKLRRIAKILGDTVGERFRSLIVAALRRRELANQRRI